MFRKNLPEVATPVSVETIDTTGSIRFITQFSFDLPIGKSKFDKICEVIDAEIMVARNQIVAKTAKKLGVRVNFVD